MLYTWKCSVDIHAVLRQLGNNNVFVGVHGHEVIGAVVKNEIDRWPVEIEVAFKKL